MRSKKVRRFTPLMLILIVVMLITACGGSDEDDNGGNRPTVPPFPTTTTTASALGTEVAEAPTSTPLPTSSAPTPTRFAGFPTLNVAPTVPVRAPRAVQIVSPVSSQTISGTVTVWGSASDPNFAQYALEWGPDPNPSNLWYPITPSAVTQTVQNNVLGAWDTTLVPDGTYQMRIHLYLTTGVQETNVGVRNLIVNNQEEVVVDPINNPPTISPIASLEMERGTTTTIALGISDPDDDSTNFIATSDNTTRVGVSPSGQAISLFANSLGVATIRIRVIDARGERAETSFLVTVVEPAEQNSPPSIVPVPSQTITQGSTLAVPLTITDPDGDAIQGFTATTADPSILLSTASPSTNRINLTGLASGSTTVTVVATDANGNQSQPLNFAVVVNPAAPQNNPPSISAISGQSLEEGQNIELDLSISDPDQGDTLTTTVTVNNSSVATVQKINEERLRIAGVQEGTTNVTVTVRDAQGAAASAVFSINVSAPPPPNQPPTIADIGPRSVEEGNILDIDLNLSDPDQGDTLTYSVSAANTGVATVGQVDANTMFVRGVTAGTTNVTVTVGDGKGGSDQTTFTLTVDPAPTPNQNPTISTIPNQSVEAGRTIEVTFSVSDPDGDTLSVFASAANPTVATIFQSTETIVTVNGQSVGQTQMTIEADDGRGGVATATFTVTVTPANQNPAVDVIPEQTCLVGNLLPVALTISDPDGDSVTVNAASQNQPIASVTASSQTSVDLNCVSEGTATIVVEVEDGRGGIASTSFNVVVGVPNQDPVLDPLQPLTREINAAPETVALAYSDPDNDPLTVNATSTDDTIAAVTVNPQQTELQLTFGAATGEATITVTVTDDSGAEASTAFTVTLNQPANQSPILDVIQPVNVEAGQTAIANYVASDPEGGALTLEISADVQGIATVTDLGGGQLQVQGVSAGQTTVTVVAADPQGATSQPQAFMVTVTAPAPVNQAPTLQAIQPVSVEVGQTTQVGYVASDPEGGVLTLEISADVQGIATVTDLGGGQLQVQGVSAGQTTVTVVAADPQGATSQPQAFMVTVTAPAPVNQAPTLQAIQPVSVEVGQTTQVGYVASDPEGGVLTLEISADVQGIATVTDLGGGQLQVQGVSAGQTTVTVVAADPQGATSQPQAFMVTVTAPTPPVTSNLAGVPDIGALTSGLQPYYGGPSVNRQAFSLAGDDTLTNATFVDAISTGNYNLGSFSGLQDAINFYNFNYQSLATGAAWTPQTLLDAAQADPALCQAGETPLACELRTNSPSVIFITFSSQSATSIDVATFTTAMQTIVQQSLAAGTVPVISLLPNDGIVTDQGLLDQYNAAIISIATGANGDPNLNLPVWDVAATMQGVPNGVYTSSPNGVGDYTDGGLQYGANVRGLGALQVLNGFRVAFP